ncbi:hypothetical protein GT360_09225 [Vibrio astriarenae]|uniref:Uncharacterized protein n=1 Tax=Vibrio astriarenae TaxID=1481923 RepID=A0A7Z2T3P8_9VIBR|nr:hypothetical protein [Vibrio astriarenae]QIA63685.1 hypothetical protein GT360_09225 [Vibrio astriarenae]
MKRYAVATLTALLSLNAFAADNTDCYSNKYDAYVDASLQWYQDLTNLTVEKYPELAEVSDWFMQGRKNHFELNRTAVHYYLMAEPQKIATEQPVESWLSLEQKEVKAMTERDDRLGDVARATFEDRQAKPHAQNYELRSAFADLLSHPTEIQPLLNKYNQSIEQIQSKSCNN